MPKLRTEFRFVLPRGTGIKSEEGRKVSGTMRLIKVTGQTHVKTLSDKITESMKF